MLSSMHRRYGTDQRMKYTSVDNIYDKNKHMLVPYYLMHSYLYYVKGENIIEDSEYDRICHMLYNEWDEVEHFHKYLVDKESLLAGTGYHLKYPERVKRAADMLKADKE